MNGWMGYELSKLHGQDLAREAAIDRLARTARAAAPHPVRKSIGRRLVRIGLAVAGVCNAEALEPRRSS